MNWVRGLDGTLVKREPPARTCKCGRPLTVVEERHQDGIGDVAWIWGCGKHRFFDLQGRGVLVALR